MANDQRHDESMCSAGIPVVTASMFPQFESLKRLYCTRQKNTTYLFIVPGNYLTLSSDVLFESRKDFFFAANPWVT